jgi:hypothetical protein
MTAPMTPEVVRSYTREDGIEVPAFVRFNTRDNPAIRKHRARTEDHAIRWAEWLRVRQGGAR